ncbi:hypothetical protein LTR40_007410, partial [Exophiala xenobiotica]
VGESRLILLAERKPKDTTSMKRKVCQRTSSGSLTAGRGGMMRWLGERLHWSIRCLPTCSADNPTVLKRWPNSISSQC